MPMSPVEVKVETAHMHMQEERIDKATVISLLAIAQALDRIASVMEAHRSEILEVGDRIANALEEGNK